MDLCIMCAFKNILHIDLISINIFDDRHVFNPFDCFIYFWTIIKKILLAGGDDIKMHACDSWSMPYVIIINARINARQASLHCRMTWTINKILICLF